jgi:hypothetical protein
MEARTDSQETALLTILIAAGEKAIEAFHASANPVDADFLMDLERVVARSRKELMALTQKSSTPS